MKTEAKLVILGASVITAIIVGGYLYVNSLVSLVGHQEKQGHEFASQVSITASTTEGEAPLTVSFQVPSMIRDSHPIYRWDFGNGTTGTGRVVSHTYEKAGTYKVVVKAILDDGSTQTGTLEIIVRPPR